MRRSSVAKGPGRPRRGVAVRARSAKNPDTRDRELASHAVGSDTNARLARAPRSLLRSVASSSWPRAPEAAAASKLDAFDAPPAIERGIAFVPALSGLACPHWDRSAAGLWIGLGLETDRRDLCQAVLEGIALRTAEVVCAMDGEVGIGARLSIDGGLSRSRYFVQFLANALGREIRGRCVG